MYGDLPLGDSVFCSLGETQSGWARLATGNITFSGINLHNNFPVTMVGGFVVTEPQTFDAYFHESSGSVVFSGIGPQSIDFVCVPLGRLTVNGLAVVSCDHTYVVSGKITITGDSVLQVGYVVVPLGSLTFSGQSYQQVDCIYFTYGTVNLLGQGTYATTYLYLGFGNLIFNGFGNLQLGGNYDFAGRLSLSGIAIVQIGYNVFGQGNVYLLGLNAVGTITVVYLAFGVLVVNGVASGESSLSYLTSGKISLTGLANYQTSGQYVCTGKMQLNGLTDPYVVTYSYNSNLPLTSSGISNLLLFYNYFALGKITIGGLAYVVVEIIQSAGGRLIISGLTTTQTSAIVLGDGKLNLTGILSYAGSVNYFAYGQISFNGLTTQQVSCSYFAYGTVTVNGVNTPFLSILFPTIGKIVSIAGIGGVYVSYSPIVTGRVLFSGDAKEIPDFDTLRGLFVIGDSLQNQSILVTKHHDLSPAMTGWGFYSYNNDGSEFHGSTTTEPIVGNWYNIILRRDGTNIQFWVNGVLISTTPVSGKESGYGSAPVFTIGKRFDRGSFHGTLDDVRLYSGAISDNEVQTLASGSEIPSATVIFGLVFLPSGALTISGRSETVYGNLFFAAGALAVSGIASYTSSYNYRASGQTSLSGIATVLVSHVYPAAGKLTLSGQGTFETFGIAYSTSGRLLFTGIFEAQSFSTYLAGGLITVSGIGSFYAQYVYQSQVRLVVSGTNTPSVNYSYLAEGQITINGLVVVNYITTSYLTSGYLIFDGYFSKLTFEVIMSGKLVLTSENPVYIYEGGGKLLLFDPMLLAWWRLEENTGALAGDSSGYTKTGSIDGATWTGGTPFIPYNVSALVFNGVSDYVYADSSHMQDIQEFTIALWANPDNLPEDDGFGMASHIVEQLSDFQEETEYTITFYATKKQLDNIINS